MLLKIYLGISVITLIVMILTVMSATNKVKNDIVNGEFNIDKGKCTQNNASAILAFLKVVIISFIPILNIIVFFILTFHGEELEKAITKELEAELNNEEI